jgi:hypothetical protein
MGTAARAGPASAPGRLHRDRDQRPERGTLLAHGPRVPRRSDIIRADQRRERDTSVASARSGQQPDLPPQSARRPWQRDQGLTECAYGGQHVEERHRSVGG